MKKLLSGLLSAALVLNPLLSAFPTLAVEASVESEQIADDPVLSAGTAPSEHAYDPFAELRKKEAEEEFRESVSVAENKILFTVRDVRKNNVEAEYLTSSDRLCESEKLKDVCFIMETISSTADSVDGYTAYDVYYEAKVNTDDIWAVVDRLNENEDILYAEPDFVWESAEIGEPTSAEMDRGWHLDKLDCENIWKDYSEYGAPGENVIVAVIDTGVDYTHSDLKDSMWINEGEIPGNGIDDDGNGYVDDIYGMDFIEMDGDPMDDMGHGTHVAGIIAMAPNGQGGVGVAYGAQIMAIKAGQSNGNFASSDIAKAINYARANGADVINMSFGGTGKSALVEAALSDAFSSCVLIASAGNDGVPTTDAPPNYFLREDIYPAGYSYVLGVMASDSGNRLAGFSNWDYTIGANCEYEIAAPGVDIYSTLPGERYAIWSGTSMAAPMVSATAAIIRSTHLNKNKYPSRYIMGQLTSATKDKAYFGDGITYREYPELNIADSLKCEPTPDLTIKDIYIFDSPDIAPENNGDGIVQTGETIDIAFSVWNRWGAATDVKVSADTDSIAGVKNPYVEIIANNVSLEDVGTFSAVNNGNIYDDGMIVGVSKPIRMKVSADAPNDAQVTFSLNATAKNGLDAKDKNVYKADTSYTFLIQKGQILSGVISNDMTLTNDKYWIIENTVLIPEGVTVTVEPGTQIQFWSSDPSGPYAEEAVVYIEVHGKFIAEGTEDAPIEMFSSKAYEDYAVCIFYQTIGYVSCKYTNIINPGTTWEDKSAVFSVCDLDHCKFYQHNEIVKARSNVNGSINTHFGACHIISHTISNSIISNFNYVTVINSNVIGASTSIDNCCIEHIGTGTLYCYRENIRNSVFFGKFKI